MQRDRAFSSYEDLEAHYQRRPSAWVEPLGDWGPGRVELLQFGTPDETHDNIAAYWVPQRPAAAGRSRSTWPGACTGRATICRPRHWRGCSRRAAATASSRAPLPPGQQQLHVDFAGPSLQALAEGAAVEAVASANANVRHLRANAYRHSERGGWRVSLDFERIDARQPVELRLQLQLAGKLLTETWAYALAPE